MLTMTFVTIGQSPRDDVIPEIMDIMGEKFKYGEIGLLDDPKRLLSLEKINIKDEEDFLVSRLRNGEEVRLPRKWVERELKRLHLEMHGLKILLCTERFNLPGFILPSEILESFVIISKPRRLGVVVPAEGQIEMVRRKWKNFASDIKMTHFSPYTKTSGDISLLKDRDLIILDCIGYGIEDENYLRNHINSTVVSARRLLANFLRNFIMANE